MINTPLPRGLEVDNQVLGYQPNTSLLQDAFIHTQKSIDATLSIMLVFVSLDEMFLLNNQLRHKPTPTDVISLPFEKNTGEIYLCPDFIQQQGYAENRVMHLWVHGLLHIAGFTHDDDDDFHQMSQHEINILAKLGIPDPYHESP